MFVINNLKLLKSIDFVFTVMLNYDMMTSISFIVQYAHS